MLDAITVPHRISRQFIQAHPFWTFVYSSNVFGGSRFGQAAQCVSESNCYPVPVCFRFCRSNSASWFSDEQFESMTKSLIDKAIATVPDIYPVVVFPKIGCGFADLPHKAPKTFKYLNEELQKISYPNIQWDYYSVA